jgi:hypothetical protein
MSRRARRSRATPVELGRAALGVRHLVDAGLEARRASRGEPTPGTVAFSRVLGVRQIVQAALLLRSGSPNAHTLGALVDATHAISMVPLLLLDRRRRSFAVSQLLVALLLTAVEITLVGVGGRRVRR